MTQPLKGKDLHQFDLSAIDKLAQDDRYVFARRSTLTLKDMVGYLSPEERSEISAWRKECIPAAQVCDQLRITDYRLKKLEESGELVPSYRAGFHMTGQGYRHKRMYHPDDLAAFQANMLEAAK